MSRSASLLVLAIALTLALLSLSEALQAQSPQLSSISPTIILPGTQVTMTGSGFGATQGSGGGVTFNNKSAASIASWSDTQVVATVAAGTLGGPAFVVQNGVRSNGVSFTMTPPTLNTISPTTVLPGTQVTLNGSGFGATEGSNGGVTFNNQSAASIASWSDTQVVATVAAGTLGGPAFVVQNGVRSNGVSFTMTPPTLNTISPTTVLPGTQVTLNGSGFGATEGSNGGVTFNNQSAASIASWSDTQVVATVAAGTLGGPAFVVQNGVRSNGVSFTMTPPTLNTISPTNAAVGMQVTFTGSGFGATQGSGGGVTFNNKSAASIVSWSDSQVVAVVAAGTTSGQAFVAQNGVRSNGTGFTIVPGPSITSLSPLSGPSGTGVVVTGSGFGSAQGTSALTFNGVVSNPTIWGSTSITTAVPTTATTGNVVVTISGLASNGVSFTVIPTPNITSLSPTSGPIASQVTITGTNFGSSQGSSTVTFNGTTATTIGSWTGTQIVATVPSGATSGNVVVTVGGIPSAGVGFTVAGPIISSLAPPSGQLGGTITINGSGFGVSQGNGFVTFPGSLANILSWSDNAIQVYVPYAASTGPVTVTSNGITSNGVQFTIEGSPQCGSISPVIGPPGTVVTINGSGFGAIESNSFVAFDGATAAIESWSDTQIVALAPQARTGPASVTVAGDTGQCPVFTVDNVAVLTNSQGYETTYSSQMMGGTWLPVSVQGPGCSSCSIRSNTQFAYDSNGDTLSKTDANGNTATYTYDASGNVLSISAQLNGSAVTTSYTYNNFGEVLTMTDALGNTTTNTYDSRGNLLTVTTPAPNGQTPASVTQFGYNGAGELTQVTDPLGHPTYIQYYSTGLIQSITDAQGNTTSYGYDGRGNRTSVIDPINGSGHPTTFSYDLLNRLLAITYPNGTSVSFGYDYRGRRTSATDQNGKTTIYGYDNADRLLTVTDAANHVTTYGYDTENNLTSITDANNHTTAFTYDAFGRVTQTTFPSTLVETYGYDPVGNLTSKTDRKGQTIQYVYDALYRLASKVYPDSTSVNYIYDLVGKIRQVTDPTGTYGFAYDNMGRLVGTTTQYSFLPGYDFQNAHTYDAASNRTSMTAPDGSTNTYNYDTLNRLGTLTSSLTGQFGFGYDSLSRRTQLVRPNGITTNYNYDSVSNLLSVLHQAGTTMLDGATYTYDYTGNRTAETNYLNGNTSNYGYDAIYELQNVTGGTTENYSYDTVGNRLSSQSVSGYSYNASNELVSNANGSYTYDANGNTLTDPSGKQYTWDFENRLTQIVVPETGTIIFKYDPFGRRTYKSGPSFSGTFLYDGDNLIETVSSGNIVARYTPTENTDETLAELRSNGSSYYDADGLESVTSLTNSTGSVANSYTYDSFGNLINFTGAPQNPFQFAGREWDSETSLYFNRARYYDPATGRFLGEDPIRSGMNFYGYVHNAPINFVDPFGLQDNASPWQVGWEWLTGWGPRTHHFTDGDPFTELLRHHEHIQELANDICSGNAPPNNRFDYQLGGLGGVPKYLRDYSTLFSGGLTGNLAATYLGSYGLSYSVTNGTLNIHVWNYSTISSATHPPVIGYTHFWNQHIGDPLDNFFSSGPMSQTSQFFDFHESLKDKCGCTK